MQIVLLGYGKMGKAIEQIALSRGHTILLKIDSSNPDDWNSPLLSKAEVAIEFTRPDSAPENIIQCFRRGIPVVCGTTGWLQRWEEIYSRCLESNGAFFYASNYSIGVNIFFEINRRLAHIMNTQPQYDVRMREIHHIHKLDAPSGTAITLAEDIIKELDHMTKWNEGLDVNPGSIPIVSERIDEVPGTHEVNYFSDIDEIEITHRAKSRAGFASGAVMAAEWLPGRKGVFNMKDMLLF